MNSESAEKRRKFLKRFAMASPAVVLLGVAAGASATGQTTNATTDLDQCKGAVNATAANLISVKANSSANLAPVAVDDKFYVYVPPPDPAPTTGTRTCTAQEIWAARNAGNNSQDLDCIPPMGGLYGPPAIIA
ncbi:MAG: hypothetical protein ACYC6O_09155 [Thermoleophilia bacterium]